MVGVPYTSKGCILCRKRKIKCDERKPQCGKCIRRGEPCPGYEGPRFIPYRQSPGKETQVSTALQLRNRHTWVDPNQSIAQGPVVREQITSCFLQTYFPVHQKWHSMNPDVFQCLFAEIAALPKKSPLLQKTIVAISCVYLGKVQGDESMLRHGAQLYNNGLGIMSRMLSRQLYTDELLYTAMIFQELEAIHCPHSLGGYVMHVMGISSILRRYLPQVLANPLTAAIYHKHHKLKVFMTNHLNLSDDDYNYISQPTRGDPMLELIKIVADIGLLHKTAGVACLSRESCQEFLSRCLVQQEKQMAWYSRWEGSYGWNTSTYGPGTLNCELPSTDEIFGPAYRFPSLDCAKLHILFWVGSMTLCPLIHQAQNPMFQEEHSVRTAHSPTEEQAISIIYADKIARSIPYCTQAGMNARGFYPGISTAAHLAMIYSAAGCRDKFVWTQYVLIHMSNWGFGVAARGYEIASSWWSRDNPEEPEQTVEAEEMDLNRSWQTKSHRASLGFQAIRDSIKIEGPESTVEEDNTE